jgi:hypothetical protein
LGGSSSVVHLVPAADLDGTELRVHERLPVDVRVAGAVLVAPLDELQVVLDRVTRYQSIHL